MRGAAVAVAFSAVLGCGTGCATDDPRDGSEAVAAPLSAPPSPFDPYEGLPTDPVRLQVPGACNYFEETVADLSLSDEQLAARFSAIASRTKDPGLGCGDRPGSPGLPRGSDAGVLQ